MIYEHVSSLFNSNIEEGWVIALSHITVGLAMALIIYLLSIEAHEQGHRTITIKYCKNTHYTCKIKRPFILSTEKPHTESDYYTYLEENREKEHIQKIIYKIAAAGYKASFLFLTITATISLMLFILLGWMEELILSVSLMIAIGFDIKGYLNSSDRNTLKNPADFTYKYK